MVICDPVVPPSIAEISEIFQLLRGSLVRLIRTNFTSRTIVSVKFFLIIENAVSWGVYFARIHTNPCSVCVTVAIAVESVRAVKFTLRLKDSIFLPQLRGMIVMLTFPREFDDVTIAVGSPSFKSKASVWKSASFATIEDIASLSFVTGSVELFLSQPANHKAETSPASIKTNRIFLIVHSPYSSWEWQD